MDQVCLRMSEGNWTVERDDDLTGTYAYSDSGEWIAFDDQLAAQIKVSYSCRDNTKNTIAKSLLGQVLPSERHCRSGADDGGYG